MTSEPADKRQSSPRIRKKRKQARSEILQAALAILRDQGVDSVTLASVSRGLGMTKQALYHYFPSKDALMQALVAWLLKEEVEALVAAVKRAGSGQAALGTLIRGFYGHYINNLEAFRTVYCMSQLTTPGRIPMDQATLRNEINPRTHQLFDALEARLADESMSRQQRERMRELAFVAWTSALGLMTMLSVAEAVGDPLVHKDEALLATLSNVFDRSAIP